MRRAALLAALLLAALAATPRPARADDTLLRVTADEALVHVGPGAGFRVVYRAQRGEVLRAVSRANREHWFQVELPDGTYGWLLGDAILPLEIDPAAPRQPPGIGARIADAVFSPAPLAGNTVGLAFSAGTLGGEGLFLFRPALVLEPHLALEGFIGETVGDQLDVVYYGGGASAFLFAHSPVTPFLSLVGGGAMGKKKVDQFIPHAGHYKMVNAGGGLIVALKKRITLRGDVRHYVVFDANNTFTAREYSGGLSVYF